MHLRYLIKPFAAVAVLATVLTLATSPATAQDPRVFVFTNTEADDSDWDLRVTVESFGGCGEAQGRGGSMSDWLEPGEEWGAVLDLDCSYTITAVARNQRTEAGKICDGLVGWGSPTPTEDRLRTRDFNEGDDADVSMLRDPNGSCDAALVVTFTMDPDDVAEDLPGYAGDPALERRAERTVEVAEFDVRVGPDPSTKSRRGCNQVHTFTLSGGFDGEVEQALPGIPVGGDCTFVVTIEDLPAPFELVDSDGIRFRTGGVGTDGFLTIDLSNMVKLPYARIAIIQDVTNSNNQGYAAYKVTRSCAGIDALPPVILGGGGPGVFTLPGGKVVASLTEGRFTVHSPNFANFGAGANYLAVARSVTSNVIEGCAVTVSIQYLPNTCTVSPAASQALTWSRSRPFVHYDFEFDIDCGGYAGSPAVDVGLPPPPPGSSVSTGSAAAELDAVSDSADMRIVARRLGNGKIEFGLEQRQNDDSWGGRRLPRARLFSPIVAAGRWLVSSPITVSVAPTADSFAGEVQVRIIARRLQDGRVEFGLQERDNGSWSDRMLPTRRYFPQTAVTNRWLASSTLTLDG